MRNILGKIERERERERVNLVRNFFNLKFFKTVAILFCGGFLFFGFVASTSAATNVYYSVGQNTNDHKTCIASDCAANPLTVTISNGVATFSTTQTATNMGVGDEVTYSTNVVAYISGKVSNTQWTLITATGGTPSNVVSPVDVVSITHAFASLHLAIDSGHNGVADASHINNVSLVAADVILNIPLYYDTGADTTEVSISGLTTDSNHYIRIYTPTNTSTEANQTQRHDGKWNDTKYSLTAGPTGVGALTIQIGFVYLDGMQIYHNGASPTAEASAVLTQGSASGDEYTKTTIENSILKGGLYALRLGTSCKRALYTQNVVAYGATIAAVVNAGPTYATAYHDQLTAMGGTYGLYGDSGWTKCRNCYAYGSTIAYKIDTATQTEIVNSASSDTSGTTGLQNIAFNTANFTNVTTGSEDFHLSLDSALIGAGIDLAESGSRWYFSESSIINYNQTVSVGAILQLTNGSTTATIRFRNFSGSWITNLDQNINLRHVYTGASTKIAFISDLHLGHTGEPALFDAAIADIDALGDIGYIFTLGDISNNDASADYDTYIASRATSLVPVWKELAGNHDDTASFESKLGYASRYYSYTVGNLVFIFLGDEGNYVLSAGAQTFLSNTLSSNQDKDIIILSHEGRYDTSINTTYISGGYLGPEPQISNIVEAYNWDAWFSGHNHGYSGVQKTGPFSELQSFTSMTDIDGNTRYDWDIGADENIFPPTQSAWSPASGATITTATPTISLTLSATGDCKSSLTDQAYVDMTTDCTGDGTTSISCPISNLGADGAKNVYIACEDTAGNKDTATTNTGLSYTLSIEEWRDSDALKRIAITLDSPSADITGFPVLIKALSSWGISYSDISNGYVSFYDGSGTRLNFEPDVAIANSGGEATFAYWVGQFNLYASPIGDQNVIYLYYDKTQADGSNVTTSVWDSNFKGVWHMGDANGGAIDSTSNSNALTQGTAPDYQQSGVSGYGMNFTAADSEYLNIPNGALVSGAGTRTVSLWLFCDDNTQYKMPISYGAATAGKAFTVEIGRNSSGNFSVNVHSTFLSETGASISTGSWLHAAAAYNGSNVLGYVNNTKVIDSTVALTTTAGSGGLGKRVFNTAYPYDGEIDEVRISSVARDIAWNSYEYSNVSDADNGLTPGDIELGSSADATISAGILASQTISGIFTGGANIGASSALTVTVPDASKTNAALVLTKGDANSVVNYVKGSQPSVDGDYTGTYSSGSTTITVANNDIIWLLITAEDTTTKLYYKITVVISASTDATLSNLTLSSGTLTPSFASGTTSYTTSVANGVTSVTVTPTVNQADATVTVNDTTVASDSATGAISLNVGSNTIIAVVTAQDGSTTETYTITVARAASSAKAITAFSFADLNPVVTGTINGTAISATVPYGTPVTALVATFTTTGSSVAVGATTQVSGITPNNFTNPETYTVTAADTTQQTYTITVIIATATSHTITASVGSHGSISPSGATSVNNGSDQSFTITADSGYHISDVIVDSSSVGAVSSYDFTDVTADHTISATFAVTSSGGGGCYNCYVNPAIPSGGFKISINGGVSTTSNRNVFLGFNGGADIKKIAISMTGDFTDASQENYVASKQWDLCSKLGGAVKNPTCPDGKYTVYAKFYTAYGRSSDTSVASSTIVLKFGSTTTENLQKYTNLPFTNPFTKYLQYKQTNVDIKRLQIFLNADPDTRIANSGVGSPGKETNYFGILTYKAVIKFQEKYAKDILAPWGFVKGTGYVGKTTLAKINELMKNK